MVVLGGETAVGRALLDALPGERRAVVASRAAQRELVALGVRTALVDLDDVDVLAVVLQGAHTVVHAAGAEPADTLAPVQEAARRAGVARLLVLTGRDVPGAVPPGPDAVAQLLAADDRG